MLVYYYVQHFVQCTHYYIHKVISNACILLCAAFCSMYTLLYTQGYILCLHIFLCRAMFNALIIIIARLYPMLASYYVQSFVQCTHYYTHKVISNACILICAVPSTMFIHCHICSEFSIYYELRYSTLSAELAEWAERGGWVCEGTTNRKKSKLQWVT